MENDATTTEGQGWHSNTRRQGLCLVAHQGSQPLRSGSELFQGILTLSTGFLLEPENSVIGNSLGPPVWQPWMYPWHREWLVSSYSICFILWKFLFYLGMMYHLLGWISIPRLFGLHHEIDVCSWESTRGKPCPYSAQDMLTSTSLSAAPARWQHPEVQERRGQRV